jgi:flagellar M-ring protein FliF
MSALTDTIRSMGAIKMGALLVASIALLAAFILIAFRMSAGNLVPLYTDLSLQDSSRIIAELEKNGVPYELTANGTQILVPTDRVLRMRMNMAEQGIPSGGSIVGYEIFDRSETFGSSNFVMNINMMRALEGELARTISSISGVENARVHLVMPKQELFTRNREKPSASVTVKMGGGHTLEKSEVNSITHLVAAAVPALDASRVTVVDSHGRLLARGDGNESIDAAANNAQEFRMAYENRVQSNIETLLERVVGAGKVRVTVAADMNFDRVVINSEKFDPEGQVARSTQSTTNTENAQDKAGKDNVTVGNNLPDNAAGGEAGTSSNKNAEQVGETTNYEISKTVQNHVKEGGTVNKISVAALVDGVYTTDAEGNQTYAPRNEEELKQLRTLITSAIGFDEKRGDKIEVVNMRFTETGDIGEESFFDKFKIEMQSIIQTLIIGVVAILAILLVLRPAVTQLAKQTQAPSGRVAGELAALEAPGGGGSAGAIAGPSGRIPEGGGDEIMLDVANIRGGLKSSSMNKINEIVDKYPEETMGVIRQWVMKPN